MLFMTIVTWEPKDSDEMRGRYAKWEYPEGVKVIGEWIDISGYHYIAVLDVANAEAFAATTFPWRDICWFESFPVMNPGEFNKLISEHMK